jgi:hypothetical protein
MIASLPRPLWLRTSTVLYGVIFFTFLFLPLAIVAISSIFLPSTRSLASPPQYQTFAVVVRLVDGDAEQLLQVRRHLVPAGVLAK